MTFKRLSPALLITGMLCMSSNATENTGFEYLGVRSSMTKAEVADVFGLRQIAERQRAEHAPPKDVSIKIKEDKFKIVESDTLTVAQIVELYFKDGVHLSEENCPQLHGKMPRRLRFDFTRQGRLARLHVEFAKPAGGLEETAFEQAVREAFDGYEIAAGEHSIRVTMTDPSVIDQSIAESKQGYLEDL
jgi:hypothetical protein